MKLQIAKNTGKLEYIPIGQLLSGNNYKSPYILASHSTKTTKTGKKYLDVVLRDSNDSLPCKWWDVPENYLGDIFEDSSFVLAEFTVEEYNDKLQGKIISMRPVTDDDNFDRNIFGKKPDPNFGFSHDPYVQSSENPEKLKEIEKIKKLQFTMSKTSSKGFYNDKNKSNGMTQYQNNPNLTNFKQYQNLKKMNNKINYGGNMANNLGGVGQLNINENINNDDNGFNEINKMNRTSIGFRPLKKTYEEKLDNFMAAHNLKYIEPQKIDKKNTPPIVQPKIDSAQINISNNEKKSNLQKNSSNKFNKNVINKK